MRWAALPVGVWAAAALLLMLGGAAPAAAPIQLMSPIGCSVGDVCQIQQYVDHDAGPGASDYRCGERTYDTHTGTDFRIPDLAAMRRGVTVTAAAAGVVKKLRDGMDDIDVNKIGGRGATAGRDCGNTVMIEHPGGWATIYCHMRKGSVQVRVGQAVAAGQTLGLVGMSGDAAFPHVHFELRRGPTVIDPFAYEAPAGSCGKGRSLWAPWVQSRFTYQSPALLNFGLTTGPVSPDAAEAGDLPRPARDSAAIVAWARVLGLKSGDIVSIELSGPAGVLKTYSSGPADQAKAQFRIFTGAKQPLGGWPPGRYSAKLTVTRAGKPVLTRTVQLVL